MKCLVSINIPMPLRAVKEGFWVNITHFVRNAEPDGNFDPVLVLARASESFRISFTEVSFKKLHVRLTNMTNKIIPYIELK